MSHDTTMKECLKQLEFKHTHEPVCPYCKCVQSDACEMDFGDSMEGKANCDCGSCEESIEIYREVTVTYSTYKEKP